MGRLKPFSDTIKVRFDKEPAFTTPILISDGKTIVFLDKNVQRTRNATTMKVELDLLYSGLTVLKFSLYGSANAIDQAKAECSQGEHSDTESVWKLDFSRNEMDDSSCSAVTIAWRIGIEREGGRFGSRVLVTPWRHTTSNPRIHGGPTRIRHNPSAIRCGTRLYSAYRRSRDRGRFRGGLYPTTCPQRGNYEGRSEPTVPGPHNAHIPPTGIGQGDGLGESGVFSE